MKRWALILCALLSGCATCQQHPVMCAVGAAVIAGSIAATIEANDHGRHNHPPFDYHPPLCGAGAC